MGVWAPFLTKTRPLGAHGLMRLTEELVCCLRSIEVTPDGSPTLVDFTGHVSQGVVLPAEHDSDSTDDTFNRSPVLAV